MRKWIGVSTMVALAWGCGGAQPEPVRSGRGGPEPGRFEAAFRPAAPARAETSLPGRACELGTVYFAFDSDALDGAAVDLLDRTARCMLRGGSAELELAGATDPRGTEEYNLALGDRRALAVKDYLRRLGVDEHFLRTRSVGEEWAEGTDEASWARDRRVTALPH